MIENSSLLVKINKFTILTFWSNMMFYSVYERFYVENSTRFKCCSLNISGHGKVRQILRMQFFLQSYNLFWVKIIYFFILHSFNQIISMSVFLKSNQVKVFFLRTAKELMSTISLFRSENFERKAPSWLDTKHVRKCK